MGSQNAGMIRPLLTMFAVFLLLIICVVVVAWCGVTINSGSTHQAGKRRSSEMGQGIVSDAAECESSVKEAEEQSQPAEKKDDQPARGAVFTSDEAAMRSLAGTYRLSGCDLRRPLKKDLVLEAEKEGTAIVLKPDGTCRLYSFPFVGTQDQATLIFWFIRSDDGRWKANQKGQFLLKMAPSAKGNEVFSGVVETEGSHFMIALDDMEGNLPRSLFFTKDSDSTQFFSSNKPAVKMVLDQF